MSNSVIAFMFAAGIAAWSYSKIMRTTGNNTQTSLIVAAAAALVSYIFFMTILGFIPSPE